MACSSGRDLFGNPSTPEIARADELASAASLLMGQGDERIPVVIAKGAFYVKSSTGKLLDMLIYDH
jgi:coenzyme F420-0:L-glutamate ligase/coenzyme F420-1:gamma-L-glutamate ligase